jgi:signal transduction histidine kinase
MVADLASDELIRVADSDTGRSRPPKLTTVDVRSSDEIGELAVAFNRVQTTAALLMEQQMAGRRNVAVMFANIARRTRGLVARQLAFIDEFERNEQDERMLIKLYRLDHLTTRLRRSADSLLVVSGIREDEPICTEASLLEVVRSAIAEIEGYQAVRVAAVSEVTILPQLVPDLRLLLAELLENATAFSPPGTPVEVYARMSGNCEITVVDHGIGLSEERLAEENRRLVERERLDIAPTSVLGLFVVGRIARRHGLRVQLRHSPGHGVSVEVQIPPTLFTTERVLSRHAPQPSLPASLPAISQRPRAYDPGFDETRELAQLADWAASENDESFTWFEPHELEATASATSSAILDGAILNSPAPGDAVVEAAVVGEVPAALPAGSDAPVRAETAPTVQEKPASEEKPAVQEKPTIEEKPASSVLTRGGLTRRKPGGHLPTFDTDQPNTTDQPASTRGGLTRRVPGTHLDRSLYSDRTSPQLATHSTQTRNPTAERAELDSFVAGVARATGVPSDVPANQ